MSPDIIIGQEFLNVSGVINFLSIDKDTYEGIVRDELDPYLFIRDAWTQYRRHLVEE